MAEFRKTKKPKPIRMDRPRSTVREGLWVKCEGCKEIVYSRDLDRNLKVCPKCGYHFRIDARARVSLLLDDPQPRELFTNVSPVDPLNFRDTKRYRDRLKSYQQAVGERAEQPPEPARGAPAQPAPPRARLPRPRGTALRDEGDPRAVPAAPDVDPQPILARLDGLGIKLGLERARSLLAALGDPQRS